MVLLVLFVVLIFAYSLISGRIERTVVSAPIFFTVAGVIAGFVGPELSRGPEDIGLFLRIAEIGLILLLFSDASRTDLRVLTNIRDLPARLLTAGMLLTIVFGVLAARLVLPGLSLWEAGILAAILAPTDAGLGQIVVSNPRVPMKIRQALNVEAGLNDGLSVPFLLFFIALAGSTPGGERATLWRFIVEQLGYGAAIGIGIGLTGGWLLGSAHRRKWASRSWRQLGVVALAILCLLASEGVGASMFIAAFVAGLAVQVRFKDAARHNVEFTEEWGQVFNLSVFFLFGVLVEGAWPSFTPTYALYAILSLTVVRMIPVAVALVGSGMNRATVLFMGWFGPRGLASIVLGLVYLEQEAHHPGEDAIRLTVMVTVLLSILLHGSTARPGTRMYARKVAKLDPDAPEREAVDAETDEE